MTYPVRWIVALCIAVWITPAVLAQCPPAPSISPTGGATVPFGQITFQWTDVGDQYDFYLGLDGDVPSKIATVEDNELTLTIEPGRSVAWYVVAHKPGCPNGTQSAVGTFNTTCPTTPPALVRPADGARVKPGDQVLFDWTAVPGAAGYDFRMFVDGEWVIVAENLEAATYTGSFPEGARRWEVRTNFNGSCTPLYSQQRDLFVTNATSECGAALPSAVGPANGETVTTGTVTFAWTAVANATQYRLFVSKDDGEFQFFGSTDATSIERLVPRGVIRWFVVARFEDCPEKRSAVASFTAAVPAGCSDAQLTLLSPTAGTTTASPVTLRWSSVPGAEAYRVWIRVDGNAPVAITRTETAEVTLPLPAGRINWYIEAVRAGCEPVVSDEMYFDVTRSASCEGNIAPVIVAPAGSQSSPTVATSPVLLSWSPRDRAIAYRVWVSVNGAAFEDIALTRETSAYADLDPATYAWYVEALYAGCPAAASERRYFVIAEVGPRCPTDPPSIIAPVETTTASSPVTFTWSAVAKAEKYRVHASVDGSDPALLGVTTLTELTRPLPPGTIRWRVEAAFEDCASTFSAPASFTIARSANCTTNAPTLASPADGATSVTPAINFTWSPVAGAVRYVLVARVNDGAPSVLTTTSETSFNLVMGPGRVEWWVVTFFSGCPATESAHARFLISRPEGCEATRPMLLLPSSLRDEVSSPVTFQWTHVPGSDSYRVWVGSETEPAAVVATSTENFVRVDLPPGTYEWFGEAMFDDGCPSTRSARADFRVVAPIACGTPRRPAAQVIGQALSGSPYNVRWTPLANVALYEVQEATRPDFSDATTFTSMQPFLEFSHEVSGGPRQYLYRVRGVSACNDARGPYSAAVGVFVVAPRSANGSAEAGTAETILQTIFLPGSSQPMSFVATADKPWVTITPSAGTLTADGVTLTVTADPDRLVLGTNTATILVQYTTDGRGAQTDATTIGSIPMSVSLVTPVMPAGKGTPPPEALIFSVVGHAAGQNDSLFQSDIRLTNFAAQTMKYDVNFTPSGVDGTKTGSTTSVEIAPGSTLALDDIVASVFGTGTISSATGVLEVRPITATTSTSSLLAPNTNRLRELVTGASSRTYNFTPSGTFGQFIPATRFADFVGRALNGASPTILSLQQVSQSSDYRSNFGFVEASGKAVDLVMRVFDTKNVLIGTIPLSLAASEHRQLNGMLAANGINALADGRVEVEVVNGDGKVTAYVSTVDNRTNDPLLVSATVKGAVVADRYVVPGVAYIDNGAAFWVSDLRIFNAGITATPATLTFHSSLAGTAPVTHEITLDPGEIEVLDNILGAIMGQPNGSGGMITVTTPAPAPLTVTARTYNSTSTGTYGQYIPAVTVAESASAGDRALEVMQLEQSSRFRTNIGIAETSGQPATVEIRMTLPDSLVSPVVTFDLTANQFLQFPLSYFGVTEAIYNARVSVRVIGGSGRVTAYGSAIDAITQDPTYVPAQ